MKPRARRIGLTSKSLLYAIVIHVVVGLLLVVNLDWPTHVAAPRSEPAPVQASVVSEAEIQKQMAALEQEEQAEQRRQQEAQEKLEELLRQKQEEEQRLAELKERQEQERQEAEELAKRKEREAQELAKLKEQEEAEKRRQEEAERKRKEEAEKKRQEEAERKRREEAERKRQEEAERKRQEEAERKRREEEERKRKAEEERKRREAEEQRQRELAAERERQLQEQLERERLQRRVDSARSQYIPMIRQKVSRNWNPTGSAMNNIEAHVTVRLSQAGEVISARIIKSSGNQVFDRSVENAVYKASPLPIPQERGVNEEFRTLLLKFKPEDMIS